jgi:HK97 family phage portal protein
MFSFFKKNNSNFKEIRSNPAAPILFYDNEPAQNSSKLEEYLDEGYEKNVIAYRCVNELAVCLASIELEVWNGDKMQTEHKLIDLLRRPNPLQGRNAFFRELVTNLKISGNSYTLGFNGAEYNINMPPLEMWHIPSGNITVRKSKKGLPEAYEINGKSGKQVYSVNQLDGRCQLLHIKEPNPRDAFIGLSPFSPAAISCDLHNAGLRWNYSLLKNGAKVPFAIKPKDGGTFSEEQKAQIKEWFNREYQGSHNAGKPLTISGVDFEKIGLDPVDMDYSNTVKTAANNICLAFGVPPVLITGDGNTFNNVREAREALFENTIIPMLDEILDDLNRWLTPLYKEKGLIIKYNPDSISALEAKRERKYERMIKAVDAGILTKDEAREELGFDPKGGVANELFVSINMIPIGDAGLNEMDYKDEISDKNKSNSDL